MSLSFRNDQASLAVAKSRRQVHREWRLSIRIVHEAFQSMVLLAHETDFVPFASLFAKESVDQRAKMTQSAICERSWLAPVRVGLGIEDADQVDVMERVLVGSSGKRPGWDDLDDVESLRKGILEEIPASTGLVHDIGGHIDCPLQLIEAFLDPH